MATPRAFFRLGRSPPRTPHQPPSADTWRSRQDEVSAPSEPPAPDGDALVEAKWPPTSVWYPVAAYLLTWAQPEDWDTLAPQPDDIRRALELLENNVPLAHREAAGRVAWMFLSVLRHASQDMRDLQMQVEELQCKEEELKHRLSTAERCLHGPSSAASESSYACIAPVPPPLGAVSPTPPPIPLRLRPVVRQRMEMEEPMAQGGIPAGPRRVTRETTYTSYTSMELRDLAKQYLEASATALREALAGWGRAVNEDKVQGPGYSVRFLGVVWSG
ncbi:uncharacterized protein LOC123614968 isoform X2 [Camelus bactrianus]|uniref:Uncharacterized protein LOC123614968 isoform X2 n=1 Tax=Camelus bactrianus TaxID=9837 RepID=A0AC58NJ77_CAMBA